MAQLTVHILFRYNQPKEVAGADNDNSGQTAVDFFFKKLKF